MTCSNIICDQIFTLYEDENPKVLAWFNKVFVLALIPQDEVLGIWGILKNSVPSVLHKPSMQRCIFAKYLYLKSIFKYFFFMYFHLYFEDFLKKCFYSYLYFLIEKKTAIFNTNIFYFKKICFYS